MLRIERFSLFSMILFGLLFLFPSSGFCSVMSSVSYTLDEDVFSNGGGRMQSSSYTLNGTLGQPSPVGTSSSATYALQAGFWHFLVQLGDINGDGIIDLTDVIRVLQIVTDQNAGQIYKQADINGDGKIGLEELVYALEKAAGQR